MHALMGGGTAHAVPQSILQSILQLMPLTGPGNSFAVPQSIRRAVMTKQEKMQELRVFAEQIRL